MVVLRYIMLVRSAEEDFDAVVATVNNSAVNSGGAAGVWIRR